jgi:hypothetical protein
MVDLWRFLTGEELTTVHGWVDPVRGSNPRGSNYRDPGGMIIATTASSTRYIHEQAEDGAGPSSMVIATTGAQIAVDEHRGSIEILARDLSVKPGPGRPPRGMSQFRCLQRLRLRSTYFGFREKVSAS